MSAEAIAYEKSLIDIATERMKERKTAIDTQIENRVRKGELIPGYKMQEKMSHSKWKTDDVAEIKVMGELLGVNVVQEAKPLTPTQVKNELKKKGIDENVILPYHNKVKTGVQLITDYGSKAKHIFSQEKI